MAFTAAGGSVPLQSNGCCAATLTNFTVAGGRRAANGKALRKACKPLERRGENLFQKSVTGDADWASGHLTRRLAFPPVAQQPL